MSIDVNVCAIVLFLNWSTHGWLVGLSLELISCTLMYKASVVQVCNRWCVRIYTYRVTYMRVYA